MSLRELLLNKKIKSPLQRGFDITKWNDLSNEYKNDDDRMLIEAGSFIYEQLQYIRENLNDLKGELETYDNTIVKKIHVDICNRQHFLLEHELQDKISSLDNSGHQLLNSRTKKDLLRNSVTFQEASVDSIDCSTFSLPTILRLPICSTPTHKNIKEQYDSIYDLIFLSRLNLQYENLWKYISSKYSTITFRDKKFYHIHNDYIKSYIISDYRREKIIITTINSLLSSEKWIEICKNLESNFKFQNRYWLNWDLNKEKLTIQIFSKLDKELQDLIYIAYFKFYSNNILGELPQLSKAKEFDKLKKTFDIFMQLYSLSYVINKKWLLKVDYNHTYENKEEELFFDCSISYTELINNLQAVSRLSKNVIEEIINFLSFNHEHEHKKDLKKDLWMSPIIKQNDNINLFIHPILHGNLDRVFYLWLKHYNFDISKKGLGFEDYIYNNLNKVLKNNEFTKNKDNILFKSVNFSVNGAKEEIDLILKVGNVILLGEAKSYSIVDSADSLHHRFEYLEDASKQIQRKKDFVKKNLKQFFTKLAWDYIDEETYVIQEVIIVNNYLGVGYNFFDTPIIDLAILLNYFTSNIYPLLSSGVNIHQYSFKLYSDITSFQNNFCKYIYNPPSIIVQKNLGFTTDINQIIYFDNKEYVSKTTFEILRLQEIKISDLERIFKFDYDFPIEKHEFDGNLETNKPIILI